MPRKTAPPITDLMQSADAAVKIKHFVTHIYNDMQTASDIELIGVVNELISESNQLGLWRDVIIREAVRNKFNPTSLARYLGNRISKSTISRALRG